MSENFIYNQYNYEYYYNYNIIILVNIYNCLNLFSLIINFIKYLIFN